MNKYINLKKYRKINKKSKILPLTLHHSGITLVTLVITIVVLLILAGVTITSLIGDNGMIKKAQEAANKMNESTQSEKDEVNALIGKVNDVMNGTVTEGNNSTKVVDNLGTVISRTENKELEDSLGNKITVPAGFFIVKPAQDDTVTYDYTGDGVPTVQDGMVIQNAEDGNQFVWVPVGNIKNKDGSTTTIKLGRYSNFTMNGTTLPTPAQEATSNSSNVAVIIGTWYFEVSDSFTGDSGKNLAAASNYANIKATDLQEWIDTSLANGGYYIGRYEATQSTIDATKAASVKEVEPWVDITQLDAAKAAKRTYPVEGTNSSNYYSDLINSYAWDTAIVFIQAYEDSSYAEKNNSTNVTTGANQDKVCNIYDMSGNGEEWVTETSIYTLDNNSLPCVLRGGFVSNEGEIISYTYTRNANPIDSVLSFHAFRITLYVK